MRLPNIGAPHYGEVGVVIAVDEDTTTVRFEGGGGRNGGHGNEYAGEHRHWIAVEDHVAERQRSDHT
jgi:hypothetical protein